MEFEWKKSRGFTTLGILDEIPEMMAELTCEPEQLQRRIICSMTWYGELQEMTKIVQRILWTLQHTPTGFHSDVVPIWDSVVRKRSLELMSTSQMVNGIELLRSWWSIFAESGHPILQATSPLERGALKSKGGGMKTIHYNGSEETVELILRTVIFGNQLSIYGAVADLLKEISKYSEVAGKLAANEDLESMEIPTELPIADLTPTRSCRETCCKITSIKSNNFLKIPNCPNCAATPV